MSAAITVVIGYSGWQDIQLLSPVLEQDGIKILALVSDTTQLLDQARQFSVDCVLFTPTLPGMTPGAIQELLIGELDPIAGVGLIPAGSQYAPDYQRHGMKGYVTTPLDTTQAQRLPYVIREAVDQARRERENRSFVPVADAQAILDSGGWQQQTLAVFSPKGGVGKSTISTNLALALGVLGGRQTLLIDGDMSRGNSHVFLGWRLEDEPEANLFALYDDVVAQGQRTGRYHVSAATLAKHLRPYRAGLKVLPGIPSMTIAGKEVFASDPERTLNIFADILREARGPYEFRVVDVGPDYNMPIHWAALMEADTVFIIVTPEQTALQDTKRILPDLREALGSLTRFKLVINGYSEDFGIRTAEIVKFLGGDIPCVATLNWQPDEARRAINLSDPLVLQRPLTPLGRDLVVLAQTIFPALQGRLKSRGVRKGPGLFGKVRSVFTE